MHMRRMIEKRMLDDSFVKCFASIHMVQVLIASSRINIKNNLITSTRAEQKLYTFIWIMCFTTSFCYFVLHYYNEFHDKNTILYVTCVIGVLIQFISYLSHMIHVRLCKNIAATEIYLTVQKIDSILHLKEYKKLRRRQYYWNIFFLILIIVPFECGYAYYVVTSTEYPVLTIFWAIGLLSTYLELLLAGSLIYYITIRLKHLNTIIKYNIEVENGVDGVDQNQMILPNGSKNLDLGKFISSLKEILRSYQMITQVFSFTVFNVTGTAFTWCLVIIEAIVEGVRREFQSFEVDIFTTSLWILYYFLLISTLALVNDVFIQEVRQTKLYCIHTMSHHFEGPIRKGASDIFHMIQFRQPVFSVYGIFNLDKSLPYKLLGIITTNVVVLIQFTM